MGRQRRHPGGRALADLVEVLAAEYAPASHWASLVPAPQVGPWRMWSRTSWLRLAAAQPTGGNKISRS